MQCGGKEKISVYLAALFKEYFEEKIKYKWVRMVLRNFFDFLYRKVDFFLLVTK